MNHNTRVMDRLFSAVEEGDEALLSQVAQDIESAKESGRVDTDELTYESDEDGKVYITDNETGEITVAENSEDEGETYDLSPYVMPTELPTYEEGERGMINEEGVTDETQECCEDDDTEERDFSVHSDNTIVQRIFSDQAFCERVFSEVIESEETAVIGDLKVEKVPEEESAVIVTSESTGDQVKITLEGGEMEVMELNSKNFSTEGAYLPLYVVGIDPIDRVIVSAEEPTEELAQRLVRRLGELGAIGVRILDTVEDAREYAYNLLIGSGVEEEIADECCEEPVQVEYSEHVLNLTRFYSDSSDYSMRCFSEAIKGESELQETVEDAIEEGDQLETESEVITPINDSEAVVEDKNTGEFTKASLNGELISFDTITEEEAEELLEGIVTEDELEESEEEDGAEEERDFSDIYMDEYGTKFFSEREPMNALMTRLFSGEADSENIEDAIEAGEEVETESEIITPISETEAVIEDKETGEFTHAEMDDEVLDVNPISEDEAEELLKDVVVEEDEEQRDYSDCSDYTLRLFSEEADQEHIEDAIENGEQLETENEVITPINDSEAVIEDKESGEFTHAVLNGEDLELTMISEEEADELTEGLEVEDDEEGEKSEEKKFSEQQLKEFAIGEKFFAEVSEQTGFEAPDEEEDEEAETVEEIEDAATRAVNAIAQATEQAVEAIEEAKSAPAPEQKDVRQAEFSQKTFSVEEQILNPGEDLLSKWLGVF